MFQKPYSFYPNQYKVHHYEITTLTTLCNSKYDLPEHLDATNNILFIDENDNLFSFYGQSSSCMLTTLCGSRELMVCSQITELILKMAFSYLLIVFFDL